MNYQDLINVLKLSLSYSTVGEELDASAETRSVPQIKTGGYVLNGFIISSGGSLTLIMQDDEEFSMGTVVVDMTRVIPGRPKSVKAGSTAKIVPSYGV